MDSFKYILQQKLNQNLVICLFADLRMRGFAADLRMRYEMAFEVEWYLPPADALGGVMVVMVVFSLSRASIPEVVCSEPLRQMPQLKKRQPFALAKEDTHDTFFGEQPKKDNSLI